MAFLALLVANIPLMLCMPLAADAVLYDLQARTALTGGVLYRDIVEPNLPGIVWCHMAIRLLMGWSEFALKWVDLVIVGGIVALLLRLVAVVHGRRTVAVDCVLAAAAMVMCGFYFSTPEWVHCQRDIWLMLPAMLALTLRIARLRLDRGDETPLNLMLPGLIEGLLWAMAFWIKPFVAVPALSAVAITMLLARRTLIRPGRWVACDVSGLLAGGLLIGAAGSLWLIATGAWPHFWRWPSAGIPCTSPTAASAGHWPNTSPCRAISPRGAWSTAWPFRSPSGPSGRRFSRSAPVRRKLSRPRS